MRGRLEETLSETPSAEGLHERCALLGVANDIEKELECWKLALKHHATKHDNAGTRLSYVFSFASALMHARA